MSAMTATDIVLYAEDDENDAFFMQRAFARLNREPSLRIVSDGKKVLEYLSGSGAFATRAEHPLPQLLILDVKMPGMSGLEVLQWLRDRREFSALWVVMFTSSTQESDVAFSRAHGANAYLVKPSNSGSLSTLVGQLLAATQTKRTKGSLPIAGNQLEKIKDITDRRVASGEESR